MSPPCWRRSTGPLWGACWIDVLSCLPVRYCGGMFGDSARITRLENEVARLTALIGAMAQQLGIEVPPSSEVSTHNPPAEVVEALRSGNKILAIKLWRKRTSDSLASAKDQVEAIERQLG